MQEKILTLYAKGLATRGIESALVDLYGVTISHNLIAQMRRGNWDNVIPFFQFLPEILKAIYATNAIESLNMVMPKFTRNGRVFPNDEAALKEVFLAIRDASKNRKSIHHWKPAPQSFQVTFGEERVPLDVLRKIRLQRFV